MPPDDTVIAWRHYTASCGVFSPIGLLHVVMGSPLSSSLIQWNDLPSTLKSIESLASFRKTNVSFQKLCSPLNTQLFDDDSAK